jgi:hypothetical protein
MSNSAFHLPTAVERTRAARARVVVGFGVMLLALASGATAQEREWPYTPIIKPEIPGSDSTWPANDIDRLILAKLEAQRLTPAAAVSPRAWVRRVYLDLIGLPPSPEEVALFLADTSQDAYAKQVDRLLDDPRYGEHWARYWLDLARYADTAGYEGDPDLPHAWRYRDYVIDSLNRDKPYDRFIVEQLAGDELDDIIGAGELPNVDSELLVAMTFLRLAPFTEPRGDESRHEMLSEMTTTAGSVFLGLTIGCAKCHDHMHDPIPTEDFYRMKAFFATIQIPPPLRGDSFQIGGPTPAKFYREGESERIAQRRAQLQQAADDASPRLVALKQTLTDRLGLRSGFGIQALGGDFGNDYFFDLRMVNDGTAHRTVVNAAGEQWEYTTDGRVSSAQGSLAGVNRGHWYGGLSSPSYVTLGGATNGTGKPETAFFNGSIAQILIFDRPLTPAETRLPLPQLSSLAGLRFWLDANDLDADPATPNPQVDSSVSAWIDKIGGVTLLQPDRGLQPRLVRSPNNPEVAAVQFDNDALTGQSGQAAFLKDDRGSIVTLFTSQDDDESYLFEVGGDGQFVATFVNPTAGGEQRLAEVLARQGANQGDNRVTDAERQEYKALQNLQRFLPQQLRRLEPFAMTLRHSIGPPFEPGVPTSRVLLRGEWDSPGPVVEPGFPRALVGHTEPANIRLDTFKRWPTRGRRKALADWIASCDNPLTARVVANRLWYRHFGRGIVATPSDFGALSPEATHPELLDLLASHLMESSWSLKSIHRLICTSQTYRQASRIENETAQQLDPDNLLLWRFPFRRLNAEVIRDRILAVSGRLNPEIFGPPIFPPLAEDIAEQVKYNESKWATQYDAVGRKRSIYIYQQRTLNMPFLQLFDAPVCDESRPQRQTSTTPLQALALLNGNLVNTEIGPFTERVKNEGGDAPKDRVRRAFELALCRPPDEQELAHMVGHILTFDDADEGLRSVCRILFNSNEFTYLD